MKKNSYQTVQKISIPIRKGESAYLLNPQLLGKNTLIYEIAYPMCVCF